MQEAWLCQCSSGNMSSAEWSGGFTPVCGRTRADEMSTAAGDSAIRVNSSNCLIFSLVKMRPGFRRANHRIEQFIRKGSLIRTSTVTGAGTGLGYINAFRGFIGKCKMAFGEI